MRKIDRVKAALGGKNVDRPPVSLWMHYPSVDQDPLALAKAHVSFQEKYDFDFIKLTPFDLYPVQDWGCQIQFFAPQRKRLQFTGMPSETLPTGVAWKYCRLQSVRGVSSY